MKIIQMIYSLRPGGAEKFVVDLSNQLTEMGHDVTLCVLLDISDSNLAFNKQFINNKVKFHSMGFSRGFSLSKSGLVENFLRKEKPDVVHCHLNVIPYIFKMALLNRQIAFFHTLHSVASHTGGGSLQYKLNRFYYSRDIIRPVCISKLCQESYEEYYKLHNAPFIDNGRAFVSASSHYEEVQREVNTYKETQYTKVYTHVASFSEAKNQDLLVGSFNRLTREGHDFTLLILGSDYDSEEGRHLQQSACGNVHFLGEKNNVNDYLLCSDAFCLTSRREGVPISLLEALSCGVTPICTPVGGIPDVITDGATGYLSHGQDVEAYCKAVKRFIDKPLPRHELIAYFKNNYSMEVCAKKYEVLFHDAI